MNGWEGLLDGNCANGKLNLYYMQKSSCNKDEEKQNSMRLKFKLIQAKLSSAKSRKSLGSCCRNKERNKIENKNQEKFYAQPKK